MFTLTYACEYLCLDVAHVTTHHPPYLNLLCVPGPFHLLVIVLLQSSQCHFAMSGASAGTAALNSLCAP